MLIIPAIDLLAGRCVRLKQGDFKQVTQYSDDPVERAMCFAKAQAKRLHIVDLDGARTGKIQQLDLIQSMKKAGIPLQTGGGIRDMETAKRCIQSGIDYLVIGSLAVSNPELSLQIINEVSPEKVVLALDVRIEKGIPWVVSHGWQSNSSKNLWQLVKDYQACGVTQILCTDISRDGMMQGPNIDLYQQAVDLYPTICWQASGGIRHKQDIQLLDSLGVTAAILGLTLYQQEINLEEILC